MTIDEQIDYMMQNYATKSTKEIADDLKVTRPTIYSWVAKLKKAGVTLPARSRLSRSRIDWKSVAAKYKN